MGRMFCIILLLSLCFGQGLQSYHCFMIFNTSAICVIALFKFNMSLPLWPFCYLELLFIFKCWGIFPISVINFSFYSIVVGNIFWMTAFLFLFLKKWLEIGSVLVIFSWVFAKDVPLYCYIEWSINIECGLMTVMLASPTSVLVYEIIIIFIVCWDEDAEFSRCEMSVVPSTPSRLYFIYFIALFTCILFLHI